MDYSKQIKGLFVEAKQGSQYKRFSSGTKVCTFIGLLPFIIESILLIAVYYIMNFACKLISAPVDYLNGFLKEERDNINHLTQAIIYAIGFPIIFMFKIVLGFLACLMYVLWFLIMCLSYIITLRAIRWQPFLFDAKYDTEYNNINYVSNTNAVKTWSIIQLVLGIIYFAGIVPQLIGPIKYFVTSTRYLFMTIHITIGQILCIVYIIVTVICVLSIFRKVKK